MAHNIKCVACEGSHSTIAEVKFCHMQNKVFSDQPEVQTKAQAKVQAKAPTKTPVRYEPVPVVKFSSKEEALEFVQNNPGSRLKDGSKIKYIRVFNKETEKYENKEEKTYTVVL